jgi:hypothetical protein
MKNTDYVIDIATKHGRKWRYLKEGSDWTQTAPTGIVRRLSAEQLLSHLLPPLAADQPWLSVRVVRRNRQSERRLPSLWILEKKKNSEANTPHRTIRM